MSWDGFPPRGLTLYCKRCGAELSGPDGPRPAETYLGTSTGLCYACQSTGAFPVHADPLDGAVTWEWPPHCPAWRRDRERFVGYEDCETCDGRGRLLVSRSDARGGSYPRNCPECAQRYRGHPVRIRHRKRSMRLYQAANRMFQALPEDMPDEDRRATARVLMDRFQRARDRWAPNA